MKFFKYHKFISSELPIVIPYSPFPSIINAIFPTGELGLSNRPINEIAKTTGNNLHARNSSESQYRLDIAGTGQYTLGVLGTCNYYGLNEDQMLFSVISQYEHPVPTKYFDGKWVINYNKATNYVDTFPLNGYVTIKMNFILDDTSYKGIAIPCNNNGGVWTGGGSVYLIKDPLDFDTCSGIYDFLNSFDGKTIEFERTEYVASVVDWFYSFLDPVPDTSITIKDRSGTTTLISVTDLPEMKSARLTYLNANRFLSLVDLNNETHLITWESSGDNTYFLGLSPNINSQRIAIPVNQTVEIGLDGEIVLYESYGTAPEPITVFALNLYQSAAEPELVDKTSMLTSVGTLFGVLRSECSIIRPSILVEQVELPRFNYVYIGIFGRYYYVTGITSVAYGLWRIELNTDVLMTYKTGIKHLTAIIDRQQYDYNDNLIDNKLPAEKEPTVTVEEIANTALTNQSAVTAHNFVLVAISEQTYVGGV